jgi:hypothetical protein
MKNNNKNINTRLLIPYGLFRNITILGNKENFRIPMIVYTNVVSKNVLIYKDNNSISGIYP